MIITSLSPSKNPTAHTVYTVEWKGFYAEQLRRASVVQSLNLEARGLKLWARGVSIHMRAIMIKTYNRHFLAEFCFFRWRLHWETGTGTLTNRKSKGLSDLNSCFNAYSYLFLPALCHHRWERSTAGQAHFWWFGTNRFSFCSQIICK